MYPAKVSDGVIRALIRELSLTGHLPTGSRLRDELARRYGCRGGVRRIYAVLADERGLSDRRQREALSGADEVPGVGHALRRIDLLHEQLALAREREESHQSRWAGEVDRLRQRLAVIEPLGLEAPRLRQENALLRQRLQAAELRASRLEEQLLSLQQRLGSVHGL